MVRKPELSIISDLDTVLYVVVLAVFITVIICSPFIPLLQSLPQELAHCHPYMRYAKGL